MKPYSLCSASMCILLLFLALGGISYAGETRARIDIHPAGVKEIELDIKGQKVINGWAGHLNWGKEEERKFGVIFNVSKVTDKWQKAEFSFIPKKSGKVNLYLLSTQREGENKWVLFDDVTAIGAQLLNPGFEEITEKGNKINVWKSRSKEIEPVTDAKESFAGNNCVKVFHDMPAIQTIEVTEGQMVTISCMVKLPSLKKKVTLPQQ